MAKTTNKIAVNEENELKNNNERIASIIKSNLFVRFNYMVLCPGHNSW